MADWRDSLLPASIGGVPILVSEVRVQIGRRTISTEFPNRDTPAREDMGRRARRYVVTAYVIGSGYMAARDAVMDVLESEGPYVFGHPWQGDFPVILDPGGAVEVQETEADGGKASFSFTLVESGDPGGVRIVPSTSSALAAAAAAVVVAGMADLEKELGLDKIGDVLDQAKAALDKATSAMDAAQRKISSTLGIAEAVDVAAALHDMKVAAASLLGTPGNLLAKLGAIVASIMGLIKQADLDDVETFPGGEKLIRVEAALVTTADLGTLDLVTPPPYPKGPKDPAATAAEANLGKALKVAVVASAADLFVELPLDSTDTAAKVLGVLGGQLAVLLLDPATSDTLYTNLGALKAALDEHLAGLSTSLPSLGEFTPTTTTPALLIAYNKYGDPTRDLEIVARNLIADPNFVPGGVALQVISDE